MALAAVIMNLTPVTPTPPSPPAPSPPTKFVLGGMEPAEVGWLEYELPLVQVCVTTVDVIVRATIVDVQVVERGNLIFFIATFSGDPDEVYFSYLPPQKNRPRVDPGFGNRDSRLNRQSEGVYAYCIDTTEFAAPGGVLQWHFWGTGKHQASQFGVVKIPARPAQLL